MFDPLDFKKRPVFTTLTRKRRITALVLLAESAGKSLWRLFSWLAFFAGLWLLQIPAIIGSFVPALCTIIFIIGTVFLLVLDLKNFRWPEKSRVDRRLEQESNLPHRPISALEDTLLNPKQVQTRTLWQKNRDDATSLIGKLRIPFPLPVLSERDPLALRSLAMIMLLVGFIVAGSQWQSRLQYGLFPFSIGMAEQTSTPVTLWITPPDYTGMAQITLQGGGTYKDRLQIPEGSTLKAHISNGALQPELVIGDRTLPLEKLDDRNWTIETEVTQGHSLLLKQWLFTRASIPFDYLIDQPPQLTENGDIEEMPKGEIRLPVKVFDDYGVTDLTLRMNLDPMIEDKPLGTAYEETRAVISPPKTEIEMAPSFNLSWHPWAGLPVIITMEVLDHKGQKTTLPPVKMTLPERTFKHPVAQQLIAFRKRLIWTPEQATENIAFELEALLQKPEQFQYDPVVFLAIRAASSRLYYEPTTESAARVAELLFDTALRIEDGNLPMAARNLREAQRNLEQLLRNPEAGSEQIAQAMQELRQAMAEYFQEMAREIQKNMAENGQLMQIPQEMLQSAIDPENLAAFLDQLQAEAMSGNRNAARDMLSQLDKFMDMMNSATSTPLPPEMQFMMEGISEMQELIEKQQTLKEQSQQQADQTMHLQSQTYPEFVPFTQTVPGLENMPPPPAAPENKAKPPVINTQENRVEQDALRYILGQLMLETDEKLGEIPEKMGLAEQEMRGSAQQLGENRPDLSIPHQEQAIEYLQDSMQDMAQQLQQMMQSMTMLSLGGRSRLDPLGRPMQDGDNPGFFSDSKVKIPDEAERRKAQEILKILRQRSGEITRPDYELDYYRRLMKQF